MLSVKLDGGDEIVVGKSDRISALHFTNELELQTWEANAPTAAEASAAIRQVGPLRMTTKVKTAVQCHAAGTMFWLSRNRLVGSYLALSAANRA